LILAGLFGASVVARNAILTALAPRDRQRLDPLPSTAPNFTPEHHDGDQASKDTPEKKPDRGKLEDRFWAIREVFSIAREALGLLVLVAVAIVFVVAVIEGHVHLPPSELLPSSPWLWAR
jgi:hypothetical protein